MAAGSPARRAVSSASGQVRLHAGPPAEIFGGQQVQGHAEVRVGERPVAEPVVDLGQLVLDGGQGGVVVAAARGGRLELGECLTVAAEHGEHLTERGGTGHRGVAERHGLAQVRQGLVLGDPLVACTDAKAAGQVVEP